MSNVMSLQLPPGTQQPSHAAVVIIGGAASWEPASRSIWPKAGVRNIIFLVDRSDLGEGSSSKPLGGVRATFSIRRSVVLGQRGIRHSRASDTLSTDIGLRGGILFPVPEQIRNPGL